MLPHVEKWHLSWGQPNPTLPPVVCVSFGGTTTTSSSASIIETEFERRFFTSLIQLGIPVLVQSNQRYHMAYCVQCGVELTTGTPACPLCHTRVLHPDALDASTPEQPEHVETAIDRIDHVYGRRLSIALLLVPMLTVTLLDFIGGGGLTWSPYVTGALICLYCWFVVPVFYKFSRPYMYIAVDTLALCSYLLLIALINDGISWFVGLALPVVMAVGSLCAGDILGLPAYPITHAQARIAGVDHIKVILAGAGSADRSMDKQNGLYQLVDICGHSADGDFADVPVL